MHAHTLNIYFFIKFRIVKLYENRHICIYREIHGLHSPWGHKELDMTERLSLSLLTHLYH